jgi:hypothetical protein
MVMDRSWTVHPASCFLVSQFCVRGGHSEALTVQLLFSAALITRQSSATYNTKDDRHSVTECSETSFLAIPILIILDFNNNQQRCVKDLLVHNQANKHLYNKQ